MSDDWLDHRPDDGPEFADDPYLGRPDDLLERVDDPVDVGGEGGAEVFLHESAQPEVGEAGDDDLLRIAEPADRVPESADFEPLVGSTGPAGPDEGDEPGPTDGVSDAEPGRPSPLADEWLNAIGSGGADPSGAMPEVFGHLGLEDEGTADEETESDWLSMTDVDLDNWTTPSLLDDGASRHAGPLADERVRATAIVSLWERLSAGQAFPTTSSGDPDVGAALDALAGRAGSTSLVDVVEVLRQHVTE